jgi:hypothetical protein
MLRKKFSITYLVLKLFWEEGMVCPVCPAVGMFGGYLGGYFGITIPERPELRVMSALITAGMIGITVVAIRSMFGIAICDGNGNFSLRNITQVGVISLLMGIIYSLAVNYLLNLLFSEPAKNEAPLPSQIEAPRPCCCQHVEVEINTQ